MNYEELKSLLTQVEREKNNGNYDQAEHLASEVLTELDSFPSSSAKEDSAEGGDGVESEQRRMHSTLRVNATCLLGMVSEMRGDYPKALEHYNSALLQSEEIADIARVASAFSNIGTVHANLSDYPSALEYFSKALTIAEELGNKASVAVNLGNIGVVHVNLSDYPKALEYFSKALTIAEELGDKAGVAIWLGNIGIVYGSLSDYPKELECYGKALSMDAELCNKAGVARHLCNIGVVHWNLCDYPKALEYYGKALSLAEELGNKAVVAVVLGNTGNTYGNPKFEGFDAAKAEEFLLKALAISTEIGAKALLVDHYKFLAALYKHVERWREYAHHLERHIELEKEINIEEVKKQESIREQRKAIEIERTRTDAKHQATQELLHNVLPPSIAHRMIEGEKLIAEKLPSVSVLFADIVNFTKLSQRTTPEELVEGLDTIFSSFDTLAEKHGLEKIKTIGDAYMVVSGAPEPRADHAEAMAHFAIEMVEAMKEFRSITTGEQIQLRIGIHSGEVVAGVIGKKKFTYDLWGDAVNTASRMESHGEAGRIHVSEEFVLALQTSPQPSPSREQAEAQTIEKALPTGEGLGGVSFLPRGEIDIKGKGLMRTYFLEKA